MAQITDKSINRLNVPRELPDAETMYQALVARDPQFDGLFIVGVKTTGIFCRPTCHARKPKPENVEYFRTPNEALQFGYRPCKLCEPMMSGRPVPDWVHLLVNELHAHPEMRIRDQDLRDRGLQPATVRRWFHKQHGMTFQAYQRLLRLGHAFGRIRNGEKVAQAAFGSGFESLSAFTESFKKASGISPKQSRDLSLAVVTRISSPIGPFLAVANDRGLCMLEFVDRKMIETQLDRVSRQLGVSILPGSHPLFGSVERQLDEYFSGQRKTFDLPLVIEGTPFQQQVWKALQEIPYGETRSYAQQAAAIGRPTAVRAVARANGDNRFAILIPCHRVIGADGSLTGYGGGIWRKQFLLDLEQHPQNVSH